jgi:hypothetical protein
MDKDMNKDASTKHFYDPDFEDADDPAPPAHWSTLATGVLLIVAALVWVGVLFL